MQVIGKFADVGRGPFIGATRIERAVAVARSIKCDQSHAFAGGNVRDGSEVGMRTRRAMKSDDGRAIACAELAPSEITAVRKLEHSEISHRARLPAMRWRSHHVCVSGLVDGPSGDVAGSAT